MPDNFRVEPSYENFRVEPSYAERKVTIYAGDKVLAVFPGAADRELDLGLQAMAFARDEQTQLVVFWQISRRALALYRQLTPAGA